MGRTLGIILSLDRFYSELILAIHSYIPHSFFTADLFLKMVGIAAVLFVIGIIVIIITVVVFRKIKGM
jgi:hypothetical protein